MNQSPIVHGDGLQPAPSAPLLALPPPELRMSTRPVAPGPAGDAPQDVGILVLPTAKVFDIAAPAEVFSAHSSLAGRTGAPHRDYVVRMCGVEPGVSELAAGFTVETTHGLDGLAAAGTLLIPAVDPPPAPPRAVLQAIRHAHRRGARIVGIGCGAFVLAAAGLLAGRRATAHWTHADELRRRYPDTLVDPTKLYIRDRNITTAAGATSTVDLCIELVREDHGTAAANAVARRVLAAPYRVGDGPQLVETPLPMTDDDLTRVLDWALARLHQPLTLADLAREANLSPRTLARRFHATLATTPLQWLLAQRIRLAQQLLETTQEPVERIARLTGLGSPQNLRRKFTSVTGTSPHSYRHASRRARPQQRSIPA